MMGNDEFSFPIAFLCIFLSDKELSLQIDQFLKQRIRHCDNAGICLETTLRNDHIRKLSGQIYVGHLKLAGVDCATVRTDFHADSVEFTGV